MLVGDVPGVEGRAVAGREHKAVISPSSAGPELAAYGAYEPEPVVSSKSCRASPKAVSGTSTSLGPAD